MIKSLSIIVPALNEEESVPYLINDVHEAFNGTEYSYEIVIVDDNSKNELTNYILKDKKVKILRHNISKGQFAATMTGINSSKYDYVALIDADGQNPPYEIIKLLDLYNSNFDDIDVASGIRDRRQDTFIRKLYSRFANFLIRKITKTKSLDIGCSLKIFNKNLIEDLNLQGDIHRILLPILERRGFKIKQTKVDHHERKFGKTNYGFSRIIPISIDALLIAITSGFQTTPRYVLGRISAAFLTFAFLTFSISLYQKYYLNVFVHKNPLFLLGIASFFISIQIFLSIIMMVFIENRES